MARRRGRRRYGARLPKSGRGAPRGRLPPLRVPDRSGAALCARGASGRHAGVERPPDDSVPAPHGGGDLGGALAHERLARSARGGVAGERLLLGVQVRPRAHRAPCDRPRAGASRPLVARGTRARRGRGHEMDSRPRVSRPRRLAPRVGPPPPRAGARARVRRRGGAHPPALSRLEPGRGRRRVHAAGRPAHHRRVALVPAAAAARACGGPRSHLLHSRRARLGQRRGDGDPAGPPRRHARRRRSRPERALRRRAGGARARPLPADEPRLQPAVPRPDPRRVGARRGAPRPQRPSAAPGRPGRDGGHRRERLRVPLRGAVVRPHVAARLGHALCSRPRTDGLAASAGAGAPRRRAGSSARRSRRRRSSRRSSSGRRGSRRACPRARR